MIRFLHIADVHLDTTFAGRPHHRGILRDAQLTAFKRAIDCALEEQVAAVLIAGDLFDNERLTLRTEYFVIQQLGRLHEARIPAVYVTGNHDPGGSRYRAGGLEWPESFHFVKGKRAETIDIADRDGGLQFRVSGAGHIDDRVRDNLAEGFPGADPDVPHIGLLHTMIVSANDASQHERYAPCAVEDLQRPGYAYWALGHIHFRQQICERSNAWYSGNLVGRNPKESGAKGGLLVTLDGRQVVDVQFRSFAPVQWLEIDCDDLSAIATVQSLQRVIMEKLDVAQKDHGDVSDWFVRVKLSGACSLARELRDEEQRNEIEAALAEGLGLTDLEIKASGLTLPIDLDEHRGQPHVLGEVLSMIEELKSGSGDLDMDGLLPNALADGEDEGYVLELLDGLDRAAAERLLASSN